MTTTYANTAEAALSREAIDVLFGVEQLREAGQNEVKVQLSRRFTLSPLVAKRLAIDLENAVMDHRVKRGDHEPGPAVSERQSKPREDRDPSGTVPHLERILTLFRLLGSFDTQIDFERSFKVVPGDLFQDRFLLGLDRRDLGSSAEERIAPICEKIGMPRNLLTSFLQGLADANHVYFGVEKDARGLLYKAYLECRDKIEKEICGTSVAGRSFPLFAGFKWDASTPARQAIARYDWYPSLTFHEIHERLQMIIAPGGHDELLAIVRGIAERAAGRTSNDDIQFLEVGEQGNPRRSFDINLYKSGLRLADLFPHLLSALRHYGVISESFEAVYQRIKAERFGHLAAGVDREGKEFMTIYYGAKQVHGSQLASATIVAADRPRDVA